MYPSDAIYKWSEITSAGALVVLPSGTPRTLLNVSIDRPSSVSADVILQCGTTTFLETHSNQIVQPLQFRCYDFVKVFTTSNYHASVGITYVQRDIASASASTQTELGPATAVAMHDSIYIVWIGLIMVILALGIYTAINYLGRRFL